ncbi:hypothetical protein [Emticicia sp. BO119]|uniref:hypothetical protein n=1 Tax=Emticicia sp. BO119 TaxID=2757768 RepID=UPI0015F0BCE0|nr:hypothetical protein [Emticicia sp. BO119]MBA4849454.1 hypothetical protein [Emticicia sp. BO119]
MKNNQSTDDKKETTSRNSEITTTPTNRDKFKSDLNNLFDESTHFIAIGLDEKADTDKMINFNLDFARIANTFDYYLQQFVKDKLITTKSIKINTELDDTEFAEEVNRVWNQNDYLMVIGLNKDLSAELIPYGLEIEQIIEALEGVLELLRPKDSAKQ